MHLNSNGAVAAFFDVDNTLVPGSAIELRFFCLLWAKGLVGPRAVARSVGHVMRHAPPLSLQPLRERKLYLEGLSPSVVEPLAVRFVTQEIVPRLSGEGIRTVRRHQQAGHAVFFITGSLDFLMAPLVDHLGGVEVYAAQPEHLNNQYTGRLRAPLPYGIGKRQVIQWLSRERNVDLSASYAYGDSPGDVESLQTVGHPQVVNPIRGMARIARDHSWPIVRWE
jgi:HAD superfamily hydrolase (TIGR01490 family)